MAKRVDDSEVPKSVCVTMTPEVWKIVTSYVRSERENAGHRISPPEAIRRIVETARKRGVV